jgi:hypothetical protein
MKYLLPPAWSLRYQQAARYGFIIIVAMLYFLPNFLSIWMTPAIRVADLLASTVAGFALEGTDRWLR